MAKQTLESVLRDVMMRTVEGIAPGTGRSALIEARVNLHDFQTNFGRDLFDYTPELVLPVLCEEKVSTGSTVVLAKKRAGIFAVSSEACLFGRVWGSTRRRCC